MDVVVEKSDPQNALHVLHALNFYSHVSLFTLACTCHACEVHVSWLLSNKMEHHFFVLMIQWYTNQAKYAKKLRSIIVELSEKMSAGMMMDSQSGDVRHTASAADGSPHDYTQQCVSN